ncbi:efflux transporter periplasmic adaptor subunit, partial [Fischerella thermalis CCMEE 5328]
ETRVVPVQAEINNTGGQLKPGMFAELEIFTEQASTAKLVIPSSAVVDVNGKKIVYVQNGNAFQAAEVILGQTSGDMVEVNGGLFEGDMIVIQRAPQLYAQSLRGDIKPIAQTNEVTTSSLPVPLWLLGTGGGGAIATLAFMAGVYITNRRNKLQQLVLVSSSSQLDTPVDETQSDRNNSKSSALSSSTTNININEQ